MSEYLFGLGRGELTHAAVVQIDAIAGKYACGINNPNLPGEGWRYWFAGPNRGQPFDRDMERALWIDLHAAGLAVADMGMPSWSAKLAPCCFASQAYKAGLADGLAWDLDGYASWEEVELDPSGWSDATLQAVGLSACCQDWGVAESCDDETWQQAVADYDRGAHEGVCQREGRTGRAPGAVNGPIGTRDNPLG